MNDTQQPVQSPTVPGQTTQVPLPPAAPVRPAGVEREPAIGAPPVTVEAPKPVVSEVQIAQELKEVGVEEAKSHEPVLTQDIQQAGVQLAPQLQQVPAEPSLKIKLPMSYAEAAVKQKQYKFSDAIKWLSALVAYQWRKINPKQYK